MAACHIQGVYIADGFADDCDELMHRCLEAGTLTFEIFSDIWKDMQMSSIYLGRTSGAEIAELSEEVLHIAKCYMVADTSNFEESVAGLFLVYSLLNLQPFANFASLRIVQEDVPAIERIELVARRDRRQDVLYILGSVLIQGPVQYQAALRERGMEYPLRKYLEGYTTMNKLGVRPKGVFYRQNAELDIIRELKNLTIRYTTAKENIPGIEPGDRNLNYLDPNFAKELDSSLKNIISGMIDGDDGDEASACGYDAIKNLKDKAMKSKVNAIRHRVGVCSGEQTSPRSSDLKTSPGKIKSSSPSKVATGSIRPKKRTRSSISSSEDEIYSLDDDSNSQGDLNLKNFQQEIILEHQKFNLDSLPSIIRNDDPVLPYEIEIIDNLTSTSASRDVPDAQASTSASSTSEIEAIGDKRNLKKTIVKSRFKRMGMLPVANFQAK